VLSAQAPGLPEALARAASGMQWQRAAANVVEAVIPADPELPSAWRACAALLPHAMVVLDLTSSGMSRIADYLGNSGSCPAALELYALITDALRDSEDHGPEHPATPTARHNLARWTRGPAEQSDI
jgi:hypothetical protein